MVATHLPADPLPRVLELLRAKGAVKSTGRAQWSARCPGHRDRDPSLSVSIGADGRVLLTCHKGCTLDAITAGINLKPSDLFPPKGERQQQIHPRGWRAPSEGGALVTERPERESQHDWPVVQTFDYVDVDGHLVYQVVRKEPAVQLEGKRRKTFQQRRPLGSGWAFGLGDLPVDQRPLYRLPQLMDALADAKTILLVEGEKDVHTAHALGFAATTHSGGSAGWKPHYAATLRGADVVVVIDNDEAGRTWAALVGESLADWDCTVRMLALPNVPEKGDLTDWVELGGDAAGLARILETHAVPWRPGDPVPGPPEPSRFRLLTGRELTTMPPHEWCVGEKRCGVIPAGGVATMYGAPGCGKSFVAQHLAASLATGREWFGHKVKHGPVIYVVAEGASGMKHRYEAWCHAHGYDPVTADFPLYFIAEPAQLYAKDSEDVEHLVRATRVLSAAPVLIVLDTLARCAVGADENDAKDMGIIIDAAARIAARTGAAVLLVHHSRKDGDQERGSVALRGGVDTLLRVIEDEDGRRSVTCEKQKDGADFPSIPFGLKVVGDSCVAGPHDPNADSGKLTPRRRAALETLDTLFPNGASATEWMDTVGLQRRTFYSVRAWLLRNQMVFEDVKGNTKSYTLTGGGKMSLAAARASDRTFDGSAVQ